MNPNPARKAKERTNSLLSGALIVALMVGAIVMGFEEMHQGLPEQELAPGFTFQRFGGGKVTSDELRGRVVMLDFWGTWCPPCREEMPWLVQIAQEYESKGVSFLAASDEPPAAIGIYVDAMPGLRPFAVFTEEETQSRYKVRAFPTIYVLDREGKIVASQTGATSERTVRRWLDAALSKK